MSYFETDDFGEALDRAAENMANDALRDKARRGQAAFDDILNRHVGEPPEAIAALLRSACDALGLSAEDQTFQEWAEAISDGERVVIKTERVHL